MTDQAQDRFILLNGLRLHYREWGERAAPPVVLLHGWTEHARVWDDVASELASTCRVLALDQRGHGESQWAPTWDEYSTAHKVSDLRAFMAALRLEQPSLIGHSSGGGLPAWSVAAQSPGAIRRLVIVDAGPGPRDGSDAVPSPANTTDARLSWYTTQGFEDPESAYAEVRSMWTLRFMSDARCRSRFEHNLLQLHDGRWTMRYDPALRSPTGMHSPPADEDAQWMALAQIAAPTLLLRGDVSHSMSRAKATRVAGTIPNCRWTEVPRSTHYPHIDNPTAFLDAVRPFLNEASNH